MSILLDGIKIGALRGWIVRLLLAAFVLRALIPAGYMPDFGAAAKGVFKVVICTTDGFKTIALDDEGSKGPGGHEGSQSKSCPFTGLLVFSKENYPDANLAVVDRLLETLKPAPANDVVVRVAGPALGSRAPPSGYAHFA